MPTVDALKNDNSKCVGEANIFTHPGTADLVSLFKKLTGAMTKALMSHMSLLCICTDVSL